MQPMGGSAAAEEIDLPAVQRALRGVHLDALATEIAEASQLPKSDPQREIRLLELSRRNMEFLRLSSNSSAPPGNPRQH